jgi:hypothetical protein
MEGTLDQTTGSNQTQLAAFFACEEPQLLTYLPMYVPTDMYIHTYVYVCTHVRISYSKPQQTQKIPHYHRNFVITKFPTKRKLGTKNCTLQAKITTKDLLYITSKNHHKRPLHHEIPLQYIRTYVRMSTIYIR